MLLASSLVIGSSNIRLLRCVHTALATPSHKLGYLQYFLDSSVIDAKLSKLVMKHYIRAQQSLNCWRVIDFEQEGSRNLGFTSNDGRKFFRSSLSFICLFYFKAFTDKMKQYYTLLYNFKRQQLPRRNMPWYSTEITTPSLFSIDT